MLHSENGTGTGNGAK